MQLYIKQRVFSWGDHFTVRDAEGRDRYTVRGEVFSWGKKLHVYDANNQEVLFIQQKVMSFLPRYKIFLHGQQVAEIVKEFTFFRPKYRVEGLNWQIDGSFMAHDYTVSRGGMPVVTISKEWFTWGDSYMLNILNEQDELTALAVVLTVDCVMAQQSS